MLIRTHMQVQLLTLKMDVDESIDLNGPHLDTLRNPWFIFHNTNLNFINECMIYNIVIITKHILAKHILTIVIGQFKLCQSTIWSSDLLEKLVVSDGNKFFCLGSDRHNVVSPLRKFSRQQTVAIDEWGKVYHFSAPPTRIRKTRTQKQNEAHGGWDGASLRAQGQGEDQPSERLGTWYVYICFFLKQCSLDFFTFFGFFFEIFFIRLSSDFFFQIKRPNFQSCKSDTKTKRKSSKSNSLKWTKNGATSRRKKPSSTKCIASGRRATRTRRKSKSPRCSKRDTQNTG